MRTVRSSMLFMNPFRNAGDAIASASEIDESEFADARQRITGSMVKDVLWSDNHTVIECEKDDAVFYVDVSVQAVSVICVEALDAIPVDLVPDLGKEDVLLIFRGKPHPFDRNAFSEKIIGETVNKTFYSGIFFILYFDEVTLYFRIMNVIDSKRLFLQWDDC